MKNDAIDSGAKHVEELKHRSAGNTMPEDTSAKEIQEQEPESEPLKTSLGAVSLSMFEQNEQIHVRVGNAQRLAEMYEAIFDSPDEANNALLDAGVLNTAQVDDPAELAGTHIELTGITAQQLEEAGFKRKASSTL